MGRHPRGQRIYAPQRLTRGRIRQIIPERNSEDIQESTQIPRGLKHAQHLCATRPGARLERAQHVAWGQVIAIELYMVAAKLRHESSQPHPHGKELLDTDMLQLQAHREIP